VAVGGADRPIVEEVHADWLAVGSVDLEAIVTVLTR
jgi:hypothetical protein